MVSTEVESEHIPYIQAKSKEYQTFRFKFKGMYIWNYKS